MLSYEKLNETLVCFPGRSIRGKLLRLFRCIVSVGYTIYFLQLISGKLKLWMNSVMPLLQTVIPDDWQAEPMRQQQLSLYLLKRRSTLAHHMTQNFFVHHIPILVRKTDKMFFRTVVIENADTGTCTVEQSCRGGSRTKESAGIRGRILKFVAEYIKHAHLASLLFIGVFYGGYMVYKSFMNPAADQPYVVLTVTYYILGLLQLVLSTMIFMKNGDDDC